MRRGYQGFIHSGVFISLIVLSIFLLGAIPVQEQSNLKVEELGEMLFNDPILSIDSTISCASCHKPEFAFADTVAFSLGIGGRSTKRNTPSAMNTLLREVLMWDGRAATLEDQVLLPLEHPDEMGFHRDSAVARLNRNQKYNKHFRQVFGREADVNLLVGAIAYFERSLETSNTPNDRWLNGEETAMHEHQLKGRELFFGKANCIECHFTPDFTADEFRNIGIFNGKEHNDEGRSTISKDPNDIGKFKVPGLRNVAVTAPYMHNGMFSTLAEVIDYYDSPNKFVSNAMNRDTAIKDLNLSSLEKLQLESFLVGLTDERFKHLVKDPLQASK
jgi:cytochrome c peroxidase